MDHGGLREGAGRPPGARNAATLLKNQVLRDAMLRYHNRVDRLTPLEIVEAIMREALRAGDLERSVAAASLALPYRHARLAPVAAMDTNAATLDEIASDTDPEFMEDSKGPAN